MLPMEVTIILCSVITASRFLDICQMINSLCSCENSRVVFAVRGPNVPHRADVSP